MQPGRRSWPASEFDDWRHVGLGILASMTSVLAQLSVATHIASPDDSSTDPLEALSQTIDDSELDGWDVGTAAIVFASAIVLSRLVKLGTERILRRKLDPALATLISRLFGYLIIAIGLVYGLDALGIAIVPILGALGIAGIALAFAFQDILENFIAGVLLQLNRPFTYGDQVLINDQEGSVIGIDSRIVTILTPDGETVKIPSATVIKADIVNYTEQGQRRTSVTVGVAYGSDLDEVERVLATAVGDAPGVREQPAPEVYFTGFGESSIDFDVRFWHEPSIATYWATRHAVGLRIDKALAAADITIPFPQRTLWYAGESED